MSFIRLYARVLRQLGEDSRLGWVLALGNVALALALFAEPVLFGRVINVLAGAQNGPPRPTGRGCGRCSSSGSASACSASLRHAGRALCRPVVAPAPARGADRLFRARAAAAARLHGEVHSGRLMKSMLQGTDALWAFWLGFFREYFAAFVSLVILVPLALASIGGWRSCYHLVRGVLGLDRFGAAQDRNVATAPCRRTTRIWPSAHRTRSATSRWCRALRASKPR